MSAQRAIATGPACSICKDNDANSIGFTSTKPLTITEHNEKNKDDKVASIIPKYGQFICDFQRVNKRFVDVSPRRKPSTN
ncbi:hypothetical protein GQX74_014537 [Glossina fuscipes]|nr:hypothetical protein GQX74_014537 [Glossina fuscipes]